MKVLLTEAAWTSVKSTAGKAVTRRRIHKSQIKHDFLFFIHDFLSYRDILSNGLYVDYTIRLSGNVEKTPKKKDSGRNDRSLLFRNLY